MSTYSKLIITVITSFILVFNINAEEVKTQIRGKEVIATKLTMDIALKLANSSPEKSKFESYDDLLIRYKKELPKNWYYLDFNFDKVKYNISKKRFEWAYGLLVHIEKGTPLGKFYGQNSYGAKANVESKLIKIVNLSLSMNIAEKISNIDKRMEKQMGIESYASSKYKSVANYLLTKGFAPREPIVFEISPQIAEKIKSVRVFFKINTLGSDSHIKEATVKEPVQKILQIANLGISKDSVLTINGTNYSFFESDIEWRYSTKKGMKIKAVN